jgi:hypothetical protein
MTLQERCERFVVAQTVPFEVTHDRNPDLVIGIR